MELLFNLRRRVRKGVFNGVFVVVAFGAGAIASIFTNDPWYSGGVILLVGRYILPRILAMIGRIILRGCLILTILAILGYLLR